MTKIGWRCATGALVACMSLLAAAVLGWAADQPAQVPTAASGLKPGPAFVKQNVSGAVNVRGQPAINSEVVTRLARGQAVTVLEEIVLAKPKEDEPARWAKIALPEGSFVWVHSLYIDSDTHTVKATQLNLRSGPGENYSILGRIPKGTAIKEVERQGDWIKIEPPEGAYAFVAAHLLTNAPLSVEVAAAPSAPAESARPAPPALQPVTPAAATQPPTTPAAPAPVVPTQPAIVAEPIPPTPQPPAAAATNVPAAAATNTATAAATNVPPAPAPAAAPAAAPATAPPVAEAKQAPAPPPAVVVPEPEGEEKPVPVRKVTREGYVRSTVSIQAPSHYKLESLDNRKTLNYLYSPSTNIVLRDFFGKRIIVTGEEVLDERWPNTPVINVESVRTVQ